MYNMYTGIYIHICRSIYIYIIINIIVPLVYIYHGKLTFSINFSNFIIKELILITCWYDRSKILRSYKIGCIHIIKTILYTLDSTTVVYVVYILPDFTSSRYIFFLFYAYSNNPVRSTIVTY